MHRFRRAFRGVDEEITGVNGTICPSCRRDGLSACRHATPVTVVVDRDRVVTRYVGPDRYPLLPTQLPKLAGDWKWLRYGNEDLHRLTRQDASELLQEAFGQGGYAVRANGRARLVKFNSLDKMREGTQVIDIGEGIPKLPKNPEFEVNFSRLDGTTSDVSMNLQREGYKVACVSAASSYHAGGGFTSGGRHALEEALCSQSTLYYSLEKLLKESAEREEEYSIPEFGAILSPSVEFLRKGTDKGYMIFGKSTLEIQCLVSIAMYNKNPRVRDSPVDAPEDIRDYEKGVERKFIALLCGAILGGANCIVIPDVGCNVFGNCPTEVGTIAAGPIEEYAGYFKKIVFTGSKDFFHAVHQELNKKANSKLSLPEEPIYNVSSRAREMRKKYSRERLKPFDEAAAGRCLACDQPLSRDLAVLLGPSGERVSYQLLHGECAQSDEVGEAWPDCVSMSLPEAAQSPEDFLRALDLDGDGSLGKFELRCVVRALTGLDPDDLNFEDRWKEWDINGDGSLDLEELIINKVEADADRCALDGEGGVLPRSLLDWVASHAMQGVRPEQSRVSDSSTHRHTFKRERSSDVDCSDVYSNASSDGFDYEGLGLATLRSPRSGMESSKSMGVGRPQSSSMRFRDATINEVPSPPPSFSRMRSPSSDKSVDANHHDLLVSIPATGTTRGVSAPASPSTMDRRKARMRIDIDDDAGVPATSPRRDCPRPPSTTPASTSRAFNPADIEMIAGTRSSRSPVASVQRSVQPPSSCTSLRTLTGQNPSKDKAVAGRGPGDAEGSEQQWRSPPPPLLRSHTEGRRQPGQALAHGECGAGRPNLPGSERRGDRPPRGPPLPDRQSLGRNRFDPDTRVATASTSTGETSAGLPRGQPQENGSLARR